jgi:transposase
MAAVQTSYLLKESFDQRRGHSREGWARRFFDNSLGSGESVNAKIRVIQRRAYGLRDEEYLRPITR